MDFRMTYGFLLAPIRHIYLALELPDQSVWCTLSCSFVWIVPCAAPTLHICVSDLGSRSTEVEDDDGKAVVPGSTPGISKYILLKY